MQYTATTYSQPSNQRMLVGPQVMPVGHSDQDTLAENEDDFISWLTRAPEGSGLSAPGSSEDQYINHENEDGYIDWLTSCEAGEAA